MATDANTSGDEKEPDRPPAAQVDDPGSRVTRASAAWVATGVALLLLTFLIVFILQNQSRIEIRFLGMQGRIPAGIAMLTAAVAGGGLVAVAAAARVMQLRHDVRRTKKQHEVR